MFHASHIFSIRYVLGRRHGAFAMRPFGPTSRRAFSATVRHSTIWRTLSYLEAPGRDVYLLGTAHISESSAREVRQLAEGVKPEIVFAELCEARARKLRGETKDDTVDFMTLLREVIRGESSAADVFFKTVARAMQSQSGGAIGLRLGAELLAALEVADELGAEIIYGDRDVDETTKRLRAAFSKEWASVLTARPGQDVQEVMRGAGGTSEVLERLRAREVLRSLRRDLDEQTPLIARALMHERDELMATRLIELSASGKRVLAVVGAAHMDGIEERWLARAGI